MLEHVIGFHDVLFLRPLGLKPNRPREDPQARWQLTYDALPEALTSGRPTPPDLPKVTRDVLVHTWDLARAVGADDTLDPGWCELFRADLPALEALSQSGRFKAPVAVNDETDVQTRLLARLGRDPSWRQDYL